jgi:hypothetical protein
MISTIVYMFSELLLIISKVVTRMRLIQIISFIFDLEEFRIPSHDLHRY